MIRVQELSKTYTTRTSEQVVALEAINLQVCENEFVVLVGPSGCGKSTLLKIVAGLIPPTQGGVQIRGTNVIEPREEVGILFQAPVLLNWRNVLQNVLFPIEILGRDIKRYSETARELILQVGLEGFETKHPRELSGGMQQRAAICRALIHDPSILLMDEPFGALDALTREEMSLELLRIWEERKKTILFVTHSISEAVLLADRVVVMSPRPGQIARIIVIDLPRPRTINMEDSADFVRYTRDIRETIFEPHI